MGEVGYTRVSGRVCTFAHTGGLDGDWPAEWNIKDVTIPVLALRPLGATRVYSLEFMFLRLCPFSPLPRFNIYRWLPACPHFEGTRWFFQRNSLFSSCNIFQTEAYVDVCIFRPIFFRVFLFSLRMLYGDYWSGITFHRVSSMRRKNSY